MRSSNPVKLRTGRQVEEIAGFLLWQVSKLWQQRLALALEDLSLASTQAVILANVLRLGEEGAEVTQSSVSRATKVDRMTASQTLRSLEVKRLITRRLSKRDARTYEVRLTKRGRDVAFEAVYRLAKAHEAFFLPLERERQQIIAHLQKLIQANDVIDTQD